MQDILEQDKAFTGKLRPVKVSANKLSKKSKAVIFLPVLPQMLFLAYFLSVEQKITQKISTHNNKIVWRHVPARDGEHI